MDWITVTRELEKYGYKREDHTLPDIFHNPELQRLIAPYCFVKKYESQPTSKGGAEAALLTEWIEIVNVASKPGDEIGNYLHSEIGPANGIPDEKFKPILSWVGEQNGLLDVVQFKISTTLDLARLSQVPRKMPEEPGTETELRRKRLLATAALVRSVAFNFNAILEEMEMDASQVMAVISGKISLPKLRMALDQIQPTPPSPIVIYSPANFDLQVSPDNAAPLFGEPLDFETLVTNLTENPVEGNSLRLSVVNDRFESKKGFVLEDDSTGTLSKGQTMKARVSLTPIVTKLQLQDVEQKITFVLSNTAGLELNRRTLEVKVQPLEIKPKVATRARYPLKGRQIEIKISIPKQKPECVALPITVRMVSSPDFKFDQPSGASPEMVLLTGEVGSIFVTPSRAGFLGYLNELNFQYHLGLSEIQPLSGSKLRMTVLPNPLDLGVAVATGLGVILSVYGIIPSPSGNLSTALPSLPIWAAVLYLGFRVAGWTVKTQK